MPATDFTSGINRLLAQVSHWEQPRWSTPVPARHRVGPVPDEPVPTQADVVHLLVQRLADLAAEAEQGPRREVPREHDLVLPDQLRVMAADLLAANPSEDVFAHAAEAVAATRHQLP